VALVNDGVDKVSRAIVVHKQTAVARMIAGLRQLHVGVDDLERSDRRVARGHPVLAVPEFGIPVIPEHIFAGARIEHHIRPVINPVRRRLQQFTFVSPMLQIRRTVDAVTIVDAKAGGVAIGRPIQVIATGKKLQTAIMVINDVTSHITPGIEIVDLCQPEPCRLVA
jgi:hypothetical protein